MNRFTEAEMSVRDRTRVSAIAAREAGRIDRQFAPVKRKARANAESTLRPVKQGEMRVALA